MKWLLLLPKLFTKSNGETFEHEKRRLKTIGFVVLGFTVLLAFEEFCRTLGSSEKAGKPPQVQTHRTQAETPGDSGWYLAESTDGSFSVQVPIPFNDLTIIAEDPKLGETKVFSIVAKSAEAIQFAVIETPFIPGMYPLDLSQKPETFVKDGGEVSEVDRSPFKGYPSLSFHVAYNTTGTYLRYIQTPNSLFILNLEFPLVYQSEAALVKSRFLESLKIKNAKAKPPIKTGKLLPSVGG